MFQQDQAMGMAFAYSALPSFADALKACSQWTAAADDLAVSVQGQTKIVADADTLLLNPALSWFKRRQMRELRNNAAVRLDHFAGAHANAVQNIYNLVATMDTHLRSSTATGFVPPVVYSTLILPRGEIAHFEHSAALETVVRQRTMVVTGSLVVTDHRILFESTEGITEAPIAGLMRISWSVALPARPFISFVGKGTARKYYVRDAVYVAFLLQSLIQAQNQAPARNGGHDSRYVSQDVRRAVWQRDGGRCVECGATEYLEYDHIIPWSKGGATSVENLQLLCRGCNGRKSDRI